MHWEQNAPYNSPSITCIPCLYFQSTVDVYITIIYNVCTTGDCMVKMTPVNYVTGRPQPKLTVCVTVQSKQANLHACVTGATLLRCYSALDSLEIQGIHTYVGALGWWHSHCEECCFSLPRQSRPPHKGQTNVWSQVH